MSSINQSTYYSVSGGTSASSSQGIAGLMSGMDTEAMVNKMLSGTQAKIDKQMALKQQTIWKQEIYRDIISTINSFHDKYFDTSYGSTLTTNLASSNFFSAMTSSIKGSSAIKVLQTSSNASTGDVKMSVQKLATSAVLNSSKVVTKEHSIKGKALDADQLADTFSRKVTLTVGEGDAKQSYTVDLSGAKTESEMAAAIQNELAKSGEDITVSMQDGRMNFFVKEGVKVGVDQANSSALGLRMTGLSAISNKDSHTFRGTQADVNAGYSFDLTLDGVQKTITLNHFDGEATPENIQKSLSEQVKRAFGDYVEVGLVTENVDGKDVSRFTFNVTESGHELWVTGADASKIGITPGSSSHLNTGSVLGDLDIGLSGERFSFEINGTSFQFDKTASIGSIMNTINNSGAGVRISYSSLTDQFKLESTSTGKGHSITMSQSEGNLLSTLFGDDTIAAGGSVASSTLTTDAIAGTGLAADYTAKELSLSMMVNGKSHTFTLRAKSGGDDWTKDEIETNFNNWLSNTFSKTVDGSSHQYIRYENGNLTADAGYTVQFNATAVNLKDPAAAEKAAQTDLGIALGFVKNTVNSNIATASTDVSSITALKGLGIEFLSGAVGEPSSTVTTLGDVKSIRLDNGKQVNVSFADGRLQLTEGGDLSDLPDEIADLFGGKDNLIFGDGKLSANAKLTAGQDAEVTINGVSATRSSNSFTVDGITVELTSVSEIKDGQYEDTIISTSRDSEGVVDTLKSFVEDYNAMIEKLNKYIGEEPSYRQYTPLTATQKKEMTDREIENWEEKAKQGLVRNDNTVGSFLSEMRSLLYTKPTGSNIALYNIGIETGSQYTDKGKLHLNEATLRAALSSDPDGVRQLFTNVQDGLSSKIMSTVKATAGRSFGSQGSLVNLAGVVGSATEKRNTLYDNINSIESRIKDLQAKYNRERTRYWNQFTAMESAMTRFNAQQSSLMQQFGQ